MLKVMHKVSNVEMRDVASPTTSATAVSNMKKINRCRSFHFRYLELCRAKNLTPLADIRAKNNATSILDFFGDKLNANDWLLIVEALYYDQVLQTLGIRMRRTFGMILDHLDSEKKAKLFRQRPVIYTKFIFTGVVEAVSNCIEFNKNLRILNLEGLPLNDKYIEMVAKALSSNESVREISFQRSNIYDKGCEVICNTIKYLEHVEKLNLSECELTTKGAEFVADMIKIQKISRYTEGWQKSLRYRDVDPDTIPGLRAIILARNPQIGDDGLKSIVEILKEDVWIKIIDMEQCGLTDRSANMILDCLEINNYIIEFNVRNNNGISKFLQRNIREQLGKDDEEQKLLEGSHELVTGPNGVIIKQSKMTVSQLKERLKTLEEQLAFEKVLRKKAEQLNEKLNQQIIAYENQLESEAKANIPEGYVIVKNESLQSIIRERNDFQKLVNGGGSCETTPRNMTKLHSPHKLINLERHLTKNTNERVDINLENSNDIDEYEYDNEDNITIYENDESDDNDENITPVPHNNTPNLSSIRSSMSVLTTATTLAMTTPKTAETVATPIATADKRKLLNVRKVRSEMKYVESSSNRDTIRQKKKNKESKSDHEYSNETDINLLQFEQNIGDTLSNNNINILNSDRTESSFKTLSTVVNVNTTAAATAAAAVAAFNASYKEKKLNYPCNTKNNLNSNNNIISGKSYYPDDKHLPKFELDNISIPTTRSLTSETFSSDSDTLRNDNNINNDESCMQPLQVFIRRPKTMPPQPPTPIPSLNFKFQDGHNNHNNNINNQKLNDNKGNNSGGKGVGNGVDNSVGNGVGNGVGKGVGVATVGDCNAKVSNKSPRTLFLGLCDD